MKHNGRLSQSVARFMQGRYGFDRLSYFLSVVCLAMMLAAMATRGVGDGVFSSFLTYAALTLLLWGYIRIFSRNIPRRQAENLRYLQLTHGIRSFFRLQRERFRQRREYVFFRCPGCGETMRVPRGKGQLRITCRRCGYSFSRKT